MNSTRSRLSSMNFASRFASRIPLCERQFTSIFNAVCKCRSYRLSFMNETRRFVRFDYNFISWLYSWRSNERLLPALPVFRQQIIPERSESRRRLENGAKGRRSVWILFSCCAIRDCTRVAIREEHRGVASKILKVWSASERETFPPNGQEKRCTLFCIFSFKDVFFERKRASRTSVRFSLCWISFGSKY